MDVRKNEKKSGLTMAFTTLIVLCCPWSSGNSLASK